MGLIPILEYTVFIIISCYFAPSSPQMIESGVESVGGSFIIDQGTPFAVSYRTHNTEAHGPVAVPWVSLPFTRRPTTPVAHPSLPICYNQTPNQHSQSDIAIVRLAHVLCRQAGFMVASKWLAIPKEDIIQGSSRSNINNTGLMGYCRGDEQLVAHCQWQTLFISPDSASACSHFLAIECGDCSNSYFLSSDDSRVTLNSPGFPVYIPLVACEWNITLLPEHNLLIKFQQFELPSPVYEESLNTVSCISGSLDVMSWHEDINKMALDGRFCGKYSPGNLTIFSNRVLIRFTSGSYKAEVFNRKGLLAECSSISTASSSSGNIIIVRWVLIGCAIVLTAAIIVFLWVWKGRLRQLRLRCCCCCCCCKWEQDSSSSDVTEDLQPTANPLASVPSSLPLCNSNNGSWPATGAGSSARRVQQMRSHQSSVDEKKGPTTTTAVHSPADALHFEQTRRLEKWHSAHHTKSNSKDSNNNASATLKVSSSTPGKAMTAMYRKDDSHIYEDIDSIMHSSDVQKSAGRCVGTAPNSPPTPAPTPAPPFASSRLYDLSSRIIPYRPLAQPTHPAAGAAAAALPPLSHSQQRINRIHRDPAVLWTPSYFPPSTSDSGSSSSSLSGIYINPQPDSDEEED